VHRAGREARYELRTEPFAAAEAWMRAIGAAWDLRLGALKDAVERPGMRAVRGVARKG
jgi:hypothetical protein